MIPLINNFYRTCHWDNCMVQIWGKWLGWRECNATFFPLKYHPLLESLMHEPMHQTQYPYCTYMDNLP